MHCGHCKQSVENELNSIGGTYAVADINKNNAVLYSKDRCSELQIRNAVTSCGFKAKEIVLCDEK
jgi:copper chaperone CopZ